MSDAQWNVYMNIYIKWMSYKGSGNPATPKKRKKFQCIMNMLIRKNASKL